MAFPDYLATIATHMEAVNAAAVTAEIIGKDSGEVYNYNEWPGTLIAKPSILVGVASGDQKYSLGGPKLSYQAVRIWMYFPGLTIAAGMDIGVSYIPLVRDQLAGDITLGGAVRWCMPPKPPNPFFEGPGTVRYGSNDHIGIIFNYLVKDKDQSFTVAAEA